jgi:hypothetical protein
LELESFVNYLKDCFERSGTILVRPEECIDQAMEIVNNTKKNNNIRDKETQIRNAMSVALEYAIDKAVPGSQSDYEPGKMDPSDPHTFAYDNVVEFEGRKYTIDATTVDSRGYLSDTIEPAGRSRNNGYKWGKFQTKNLHKNLIDVIVGGHITITKDDFILCDFDLIVKTDVMFDASNWQRSNQAGKMFLPHTHCAIVNK